MSIDRNAILQGVIDQYQDYSTNTSGVDIKQVLKFSGRNFDINRRGDIGAEVAVFKLENATTDTEVDDNKPTDLLQNVQVMIFIEQADAQSVKEARYDRMLALTDDIMNWARVVVGSDVNTGVYSVALSTIGSVEEEEGYLSCVVNLELEIDIL